MSSLHEIKARINNINSTKKITRAMYLISASKSQKAKSQLESVAPYFQHITDTMTDILARSEAINTVFIAERHLPWESCNNLYIVLGGDKGMAGGYNHNIIDFLSQHCDKDRDDVLVAGILGRMQIRQQGYRVGQGMDLPVMNPSIYRAREVAERVVEEFHSNKYNEIHLIYTDMISALKQEPVILQLLPLDLEKIAPHPDRLVKNLDEIEYQPSAREVFDKLVPHYLKGIIYSAFVKAFASEQHARMYAMDGATKNANESIGQLSISYNRARQAKITQELTEIVGGIPQE